MSLLYAILDFPAVKWAFLVLALVMPLASLLTWAERRQSAMMQDRLGPNRANIGPIKLKGILHFVADALKMIFKEDFIPANVHKGLFALAPILALAPVLIAFAIIPFGPTIFPHSLREHIDTYKLATTPGAPEFADAIRLQIFQIDFGLIFYFAVLTIANYGGTIAGWASYNKWALLGGLRSSSQMMSYEVAMGLGLMPIFLAFGSLEPGRLVFEQGSQPWNWGLIGWAQFSGGLLSVVGAATLVLAFLLFFTSAIAETKRAPFDIPEGEPEIIGYFVEYSGLRFGMFFLGEFLEIVTSSAIMISIFFGGWHWGSTIDGFLTGHLPNILFVLAMFGLWTAKVFAFCSFQLLIRWSLPRFRSDQLMRLGWQRLLPISIANVVATAIVILWAQAR